jgi:hypothetical protein
MRVHTVTCTAEAVYAEDEKAGKEAAGVTDKKRQGDARQKHMVPADL